MKSFINRLICFVILVALILPSSNVAANLRLSHPMVVKVLPAAESKIFLPLVKNDFINLPPIIPETTNILINTTTQYLTSISGNGGIFTFTQSTPALEALSPGEVIVSEPTTAAPDGFLRKITSMSNVGGQVIIQTEATTLEEAIQQGVGQISHELTPEEIITGTLSRGVTLERTPQALQQGVFYLKIQDVVLYDDDSNPDTTNDQIVANGSITLKQSFFFMPVFQDWQLIRADFTNHLTETAELQIGANVDLPIIQREVEIARYTFAPITFCIGCPSVFFPVTLKPMLSINVGVDGSVHVGLSTSVTQQATLTGGLSYVNATWWPISQFTNAFQYNPPTLSAGMDLKGYAGTELSLMLYGIAGPKAEVSTYLELEANPLSTPWWVLFGGLDVKAGISMEPLSNLIPDYEKTVVDFSKILAQAQSGNFNFRKQLFDSPSTLYLWIQDLNPTTGYVSINGVDTQQPSTPFTWDWGDGTIEDWGIARSHIYTSRTKNYNVKVVSHYADGGTDEAEILIRFVSSAITPMTLPSNLAVTIPDHDVTLATRLYPIPGGLTYFDDSYFDLMSRPDTEYVLSVVAAIQNDYANGNVFLINNGFEQIVLRDPNSSGMYSLWYTNPPSFASGNYGFQDTFQYNSFFHEMGHNFTLNSPADYYYGGKIDGYANAIFSESIANIFAYATAYDILNNPSPYGFDITLVLEIEQSASNSIRITRDAYENYISTGKVFHSWNDPTTTNDETFWTFMTIAYKFCAHAEDSGHGYRVPLKRMMALLQHFNENWRNNYEPYNNTSEAEIYRATLMVAALSYAFSTDLRAEFRDLNFPISDVIYNELIYTINP